MDTLGSGKAQTGFEALTYTTLPLTGGSGRS
jgi:hypothetical protein